MSSPPAGEVARRAGGGVETGTLGSHNAKPHRAAGGNSASERVHELQPNVAVLTDGVTLRFPFALPHSHPLDAIASPCHTERAQRQQQRLQVHEGRRGPGGSRLRHRRGRRFRTAFHRRTGRAHPHREGRRAPTDAFPRHPFARGVRRRARTLERRLPSGLQDERGLHRRLHARFGQRRRHPSSHATERPRSPTSLIERRDKRC